MQAAEMTERSRMRCCCLLFLSTSWLVAASPASAAAPRGRGSRARSAGQRRVLDSWIRSLSTTQPRLRRVRPALTFSARFDTKGRTAVSKESLTPLNRFTTKWTTKVSTALCTSFTTG